MAIRSNPNPAKPDEMMLLMQRLRALQLRLSSVDSVTAQEAEERVLSWRAAVGETRARENRRNQLHKYVADSTGEVNSQFEQEFENGYVPRIVEAFDTLLPQLERRTAAVFEVRALEFEDEYGGRLAALERRTVTADAQLMELRTACEDTYKRFTEVTRQLDQIWDNDDSAGVGGWRDYMRQAGEAKDATDRKPLQVFKENSQIDDSDLDGPGWVGMKCPACNEPTGRRKRRAGVMDDLLSLVNVSPYWCERCMVRFYRMRQKRRRPA